MVVWNYTETMHNKIVLNLWTVDKIVFRRIAVSFCLFLSLLAFLAFLACNNSHLCLTWLACLPDEPEMFANLEFEANAVGGEEGDDHVIGVWFDWLLCFWHSHPPPQVTFTVKLALLITSKAFDSKQRVLQNEQMGEGPMNAHHWSVCLWWLFFLCWLSFFIVTKCILGSVKKFISKTFCDV